MAVLVQARCYCAHAQSEPGTVYTIERTPVGWACSCLGYEHTGVCKHIGAVERRAEREGWPFGTIAPLATVGRYMPLGDQDQDPDPEPNSGAAVPRRGAAPLPALSIAQHRAHKAAPLADLYGDAA